MYNSAENMQPDNNTHQKTMTEYNLTNFENINFSYSVISILGIKHTERIVPQKLYITVTLYLKINSNSIRHSIRKIKKLIHDHVSIEKPFLLERLTFLIAHLIMESFPSASFLELTIKKPEAIAHAQNAHVTIRIE
jgi:FolB domain-containing protein